MIRHRYLLITMALAAAAGIGLLLPGFVGALSTFGRFLTVQDVERDYAIALVSAAAIGMSIPAWPVPAADKKPLLIVWLVKIIVVLGAMLLYEWNYILDAPNYFRRAIAGELGDLASPISRGTEVVVRLTWLINKAIPHSYHATKVLFALIGLVAVYLFYRATVRHTGSGDVRPFYWIALFPSVLFWSSILGKEPVHLLGIAIYAYGIVAWRGTGRTRYVGLVLLGVVVATTIRSWSAPILLFPVLVFAVMGLTRPWARVAFTIIAIGAFAWSTLEFARIFQIESVADLQQAAESRAVGWEGGSAQQRDRPFQDVGGLARFAPWGAFTALFRPLPGEVRNPFGLIAGVENLILLGLLGLAMVRTRWDDLRDPVLVWAITFVVTWAVVYGFVSYYNFGAAVRFKLQILPVLLLVLLHLARRRTAVPGAGTPAAPGSSAASPPGAVFD